MDEAILSILREGSASSLLEVRSFRLDRVLDELNLLGNGGQLVLFQTVEFIEAPPSATLCHKHIWRRRDGDGDEISPVYEMVPKNRVS